MLGRMAALAVLCCLAGPALAQGPSTEVAPENHPELVEIYRLRIVNDRNGGLSVSRDQGKSWTAVGQVIRWAGSTDRNGFTASRWGRPATVVATAVNAIHLKIAEDPQTGRGVVFSIMPKQFLAGVRDGYSSFFSPTASIYTDIPGGEGIFGAHLAPLVGNPVLLEEGEGSRPLPADYVPKRGDVLVIPVERPRRYPYQLVFENRFQGLIHLGYVGEPLRPIGTVLRPVWGIGRFEGAVYAAVGRIRANHPGVIDVSCSPLGWVGGFQIIPAGHAMSPEMERARTMSQWMVVGPLDSRSPTWEGVAPLFLEYLQPAYDKDDILSPDWKPRLLTRFVVEVRIKGGRWVPMPEFRLKLQEPLPDWANTALKDVTHIRILFPMWEAVGM